jgi:hypothetical protein
VVRVILAVVLVVTSDGGSDGKVDLVVMLGKGGGSKGSDSEVMVVWS